ncbi:MAG: GTPase Era [Ignavibacteriae bacterium]|nr:GTPase Era [Ignavibacteriota bacterium]
MEEELHISEDFRCGYATIIGGPNVGKSTLMNAFLQQKISIVTPKAQTTRHKVLGILSTNEYQVIFLDTPGLIKPKYRLQEVMMQFASSAIEDADLLLLMIDATNPGTGSEFATNEAWSALKGLNKSVFLVINKIDLVKKADLLPVIDSCSRAYQFKEIFPISALTREGTTELLKTVANELPRHPPLFPLDIVSEQNERFFVSEIVREKVFLATHQEIPYSTAVDIVEFKDREEGKTLIRADIYVERDSQKGIIIGKRGTMLRAIGSSARREIEEFLQRPVFLDLHVRVKRQWRENEQWLRRLGY